MLYCLLFIESFYGSLVNLKLFVSCKFKQPFDIRNWEVDRGLLDTKNRDFQTFGGRVRFDLNNIVKYSISLVNFAQLIQFCRRCALLTSVLSIVSNWSNVKWWQNLWHSSHHRSFGFFKFVTLHISHQPTNPNLVLLLIICFYLPFLGNHCFWCLFLVFIVSSLISSVLRLT